MWIFFLFQPVTFVENAIQLIMCGSCVHTFCVITYKFLLGCATFCMRFFLPVLFAWYFKRQDFLVAFPADDVQVL